MKAVQFTIIRYVDDAQPGWVEAVLVDVWGQSWHFVDKVPIFTAAPLDASSTYPQPGLLACEIVGVKQDATHGPILTVDTAVPFAVESSEGKRRFEIVATQLVDI